MRFVLCVAPLVGFFCEVPLLGLPISFVSGYFLLLAAVGKVPPASQFVVTRRRFTIEVGGLHFKFAPFWFHSGQNTQCRTFVPKLRWLLTSDRLPMFHARQELR